MNLLPVFDYNGSTFVPSNAEEIGVKLDWTGDAREAELTVDSILLENDGKRFVLEHIEALGIFEGMPITATIGGIQIDYYIDLTDANTKISANGDGAIEVTIKRRKAVDWFRQQADGMSFEALNITHPISTLQIPYLIVKDNQLEMLIMLAISTYTLVKALVEGIQGLVDVIAAGTVESATPIPSVPVPTTNIGAIIAFVLRILAYVVYLAALTLALIDLTKQMIELLFPPIRNFKGCTVLELFNKGCAKLGYSFSSTILSDLSKLTILPVPLQKTNESIFTNLFTLDNGSYTKGYPTANDTVSTFGRLIQETQEMFNAKIRIVGNTVYLERRDYWIENSGVTIKNTLNIQDKRENQHSYDSSVWWKRYYMHYQTDPSDVHTLDQIDRTDVEYSTEPVTVQNADLVSIKGLVDIAIPYAFAIRKNQLTFVEEAAIPFAKAADEVVQFFGGDSDYEAQIQGRVGITQISQQYFTVTKLMYAVNGRQPDNYLDLIGASKLYTDYHAINKVKENFQSSFSARIPFSKSKFSDLIDNNFVTDQNGTELEIKTFEYVPDSAESEITYTTHTNEGDNTKTILINA